MNLILILLLTLVRFAIASRRNPEIDLEKFVQDILTQTHHLVSSEPSKQFNSASHPMDNVWNGKTLLTSDYTYKCVKPGHFALTFDDGPSQYTEEFLDILKTLHVRATFFIVGTEVDSSYKKDLLRRMVAEGHTVASHTWSHPSLPTLSDDQIKEELDRTESVIKSAIGKAPALFRPPYGDCDTRVLSILKKRGYKPILWNLDTRDWSVRSYDPSLIFESFKSSLNHESPSSTSWISLQHDIFGENLNYLKSIIKFIRKKGFKIVDMATCLGTSSDSLYKPSKKNSINNTLPQANQIISENNINGTSSRNTTINFTPFRNSSNLENRTTSIPLDNKTEQIMHGRNSSQRTVNPVVSLNRTETNRNFKNKHNKLDSKGTKMEITKRNSNYQKLDIESKLRISPVDIELKKKIFQALERVSTKQLRSEESEESGDSCDDYPSIPPSKPTDKLDFLKQTTRFEKKSPFDDLDFIISDLLEKLN